MNYYQQGDVLLKQIDHLPNGAVPKSPESAGYILARGEATGHHHAIAEEEGVELYTLDEILYLVADHKVTVQHQEHGPITVPAGTYQIGQVQEYNYMEREAQRVRD